MSLHKTCNGHRPCHKVLPSVLGLYDLSDLISYSFPLSPCSLRTSHLNLQFLTHARHTLPLLYPLQEVVSTPIQMALCLLGSVLKCHLIRQTFPDPPPQAETSYPYTISSTLHFFLHSHCYHLGQFGLQSVSDFPKHVI